MLTKHYFSNKFNSRRKFYFSSKEKLNTTALILYLAPSDGRDWKRIEAVICCAR